MEPETLGKAMTVAVNMGENKSTRITKNGGNMTMAQSVTGGTTKPNFETPQRQTTTIGT